ncbi:MAG: hypothetical protein ACRDGN_01975 [bacterium]
MKAMRACARVAVVLALVLGVMMVPATAEAAVTVKAGGTRVGYYDTGGISGGIGQSEQVPPITTAGGTAILITDPTAAQLSGIDVLFAQNGRFTDVGSEWLSRAADVAAWVSGGGVLIMHDRWVNAGISIPGSRGISFVRNTDTFSRDIDVNNSSTRVTNGPGGIVTNTTLDTTNGPVSSNGYVAAATLPGGAVNPLVRGDTGGGGGDAVGIGSAPASLRPVGVGPLAARSSEVVTTCYAVGSGRVIYSTINLAYYLDSNDVNFRTIYAPNVVKWGMEGACAGGFRFPFPLLGLVDPLGG